MKIPEAIMNELRQCEWSVGGSETSPPRWIALSAPYDFYISKNRRTTRNKYTGETIVRKAVKDWMKALGWLVKFQHIEDWQTPLTVRCDGEFKDKRSAPDLSNLSYVVLDAIQEATGVNDSEMRWEDGERTITGTNKPMIYILIEEAK